jgi:mRNA-degrading endonuclease toxin of MazEF toxin-antitoxin module
VIPITYAVESKARYLRTHIPPGTAGLKKPADIMIDLVRTINNKRFVRTLGKLPSAIMAKMDQNLAIILGLDK